MAQPDLKGLLSSSKQINIAVIGRKSGKQRSFPVWFVLEGDKLLLLPIHGSENEWYRNVIKNQSLEIASVKTGLFSSHNVGFHGEVSPITDAARVQEIIGKFKAKYGEGAVRHHYQKFDVGVEVTLQS